MRGGERERPEAYLATDDVIDLRDDALAPEQHEPLEVDRLFELTRAHDQWRGEDWGPGDAWGSLASARQYRLLFQLLDRWVPENGRVLDWGSGSGRISFCLLKAGFDVSAFDLVEPPRVADLAAAGPGRFMFEPATSPTLLPFPDDHFDAVTSVGVLEHVRETGGAELPSLFEIGRVLRPGGRLICCHFPNKTSWIDFVAKRTEGAHSHPYKYTASDIRALTHNAGLELESLERYGMLPRNRASGLPASICQTKSGADAFDALDRALAVPARPLCQNFAFVATKPFGQGIS